MPVNRLRTKLAGRIESSLTGYRNTPGSYAGDLSRGHSITQRDAGSPLILPPARHGRMESLPLVDKIPVRIYPEV